MAVIKHIAIKNASYSASEDYLKYEHEEYTNKALLDEGGMMIEREGILMEGVNCDLKSFSHECRELNEQYGKNNTRAEVKAHHYIISFDPRDRDENGLTVDRAQELGLEFTKKNFPGHQALVCTHPDGHNSAGNIHVHIVINSLRKFDVERQPFMDRPCDALAGYKHHVSREFLEYLKKETMQLCQKESLYQVDLLSPAEIKITDREYWAQRRGQATLDAENAAIIDEGIQPEVTHFETQNGFLRAAIQSVLNDCSGMDEFRKKLLQSYGIELRESRGRFSYHLPDQTKPVRARRLGTRFEKESIEDFFKAKAQEKDSLQPHSKPQAHHRPQPQIRLLIDVQACIKAMENPAYAQKVKSGNLQEMVKTYNFLRENQVGAPETLSAMLASTKEDYEGKKAAYDQTKEKLDKTNLLIRNTGQYLANKKSYSAYLKAKDKKAYREEHRTEIALYEAARKVLKEYAVDGKLPDIKSLKAQKATLTAKKDALYAAYSDARAKYREIRNAEQNVQRMYGAQLAKTQSRSTERG